MEHLTDSTERSPEPDREATADAPHKDLPPEPHVYVSVDTTFLEYLYTRNSRIAPSDHARRRKVWFHGNNTFTGEYSWWDCGHEVSWRDCLGWFSESERRLGADNICPRCLFDNVERREVLIANPRDLREVIELEKAVMASVDSDRPHEPTA